MNVTCFYDQTPFTLSMEEKIAALRKMHAENLHHYDARCPRCGRANAISRERLEMFTPGWEEAIKAPPPAPMLPSAQSGMMPPAQMPAAMPAAPMAAPAKKAPAKKAPSRRRHAPSAKRAAKKVAPKKTARKAARKTARKATRAKPRRAARKPAPRKSGRPGGRKR
jgi:hypothetical protein